jgi:hypothetical protein
VARAAVAALDTVALLGLVMAALDPRVPHPRPVVVGHGILTVTILVLVLFTALGAGH